MSEVSVSKLAIIAVVAGLAAAAGAMFFLSGIEESKTCAREEKHKRYTRGDIHDIRREKREKRRGEGRQHI